jgi:hypothetical protein
VAALAKLSKNKFFSQLTNQHFNATLCTSPPSSKADIHKLARTAQLQKTTKEYYEKL